MNPTLINGFEDIVAHIKNQEQRIMALEEENKKLKQTCLRWQEKADFNLDMSCDECGLTTTEDDLQISLKHGSLICEGCYDEKEEEYQPKGSRIDPEGLHDFMKEAEDLITCERCDQNSSRAESTLIDTDTWVCYHYEGR